MKNGQTAILLFIRKPAEEGRIKKLAGNRAFGKSMAVARHFNAHTKAMVKATGLPCHTITSNEQRGATFGERLTNAFREIFELGYENVIALGNDHPGLKPTSIKSAAEALEKSNTVLGPAEDGGLYLIGMNRKFFCPASFQELSWQTPSLQKAFQDYLTGLKAGFQWLATLKDVDSFSQLLNVLEEIASEFHCANLYLALQKLLFTVQRAFTKPDTTYNQQIFLLPISLRGPPQ